jgi:CRP/FNR family transcriptional regulator
MLFFEGDSGADVFQIISGTVRFSSIDRNGRRVVAGFAVAGDVFSLSNCNRYLFSAEAVSECSFRRFSRSAVEQYSGNVALASIVDYVTREPWTLQFELLQLLHKNADEAIAYFVNNIGCRQQGQLSNGSVVRLDMQRCDIADYLGLTVETVCRGISRLAKEGILQASGPRDLIVHDVSALRIRAGVEDGK